MTGILLAAGSIGVVCAAGSGLVAALKFFNTWEPEFKGKSKPQRGGAHHDKLDNLAKRTNTRGNL